MGYYPYPGYSGSNDGSSYGDVWITNRYSSYNNPTPGSWEYQTYIHEIGHAIGMKHPGNYDAGGGGTPGPYLPSGEDSHQYTVMSYYSGPSYGSLEPITPQLYDVAAIQYLYGANTSTRSGTDTYTFSTSTQIKTIWDGGGSDTFDASNQSSAVTINLHQGAFSSIAGTNNVAIAYDAVIESAIGSNYNDTLRASDVNSTLNGGAGNDTLVGGAGADTLIGGTGVDTITGGVGADTFKFSTGQSSAASGQHDRIADFTQGSDLIDLTGIDADTTTLGVQPFHFLGTGAFDGLPTALHYYFDASRGVTVLEGDVNGDRVADFGIDLTGNIALSSTDFSSGSLRPVVPLTLTGTAGSDTLNGDLLDDTLSGLGGDDTLRGYAGNDFLDGGTGADTMVGGTGNDTYVVDNAGDVVTEVATAAFSVPSGWTVKGVADFDLDGQQDLLVTNGSVNRMWLMKDGAIQSTINLFWWSDWTLQGLIDVNADGYKEVFYQEVGTSRQEADIYNGGTTRQTWVITSGRTADAVGSLPAGTNEGTDTVQASVSYTLPTGVENLTLVNGAGNLNGTGNGLSNVIVGNDGNNILNGKGGVDTLTGGAGTDTFVFEVPTGGMSTVTDFVSGTDTLQVSASGFGGSLVANASVTVVTAGSAAAASNAGSTGYFIFDNTGTDAGTVFWDPNGGSGSDAIAVVKLQGVTSLLPSDFHVV